MSSAPSYPGWKRFACVVLATMLLAAVGGRALASTLPGQNNENRPPAGEKEKTLKHQPPASTHGFDVSRAAHETPPGPGHGRAVSAVARAGHGSQQHHANGGGHERHSSNNGRHGE